MYLLSSGQDALKNIDYSYISRLFGLTIHTTSTLYDLIYLIHMTHFTLYKPFISHISRYVNNCPLRHSLKERFAICIL